jgi:hypothetical protein
MNKYDNTYFIDNIVAFALSEEKVSTVTGIDKACENLKNSTCESDNAALFILTHMRNNNKENTEEKPQFWWLDSPPLAPSKYDGGGPYTLVSRAKKGDHITVRTITRSQGHVNWYHAVYIDSEHIAQANSPIVTLDAFVAGLLTDDNCVDSAGVIQYEGDTSLHRSITAGVAVYSDLLSDSLGAPGSQCFVTYCRSGQCFHSELWRLLGSVPPNMPSPRKRII